MWAVRLGCSPGSRNRAIEVEAFRDPRGRLAHWPLDGRLGFVPRRMYIVDGGAYRRSHPLLLATPGKMRVALDDGRMRVAVMLSDTAVGLHVPTSVWTLQIGRTAVAALLVLASELYMPEKSVTDYARFLVEVAA